MKRLYMVICLAMLSVLAYAGEKYVFTDGTNFLASSGSVTNTITTNYWYFLDATNYVHRTADAANWYLTRCSNGIINIKTNSLYP